MNAGRKCLAVRSGKVSGLVRRLEGADVLRAVGIPGRLLTVEWSGPGAAESSFLFHAADGTVSYGRHRPEPGAGSLGASVREAAAAGPYSGSDPILEPLRIAYAACGPDGTDPAASRVAGAVEEFLGALDRDLLKLPVGRPLTGREYALLSGRPERVQAVAVFPWLLPWTCAGLAAGNPEPAERVLAAIDARAELLPALCREFRAEPNVVRSLAAVGAWHPRARGYPVADFETDPAFYAAAFSLVPPERRPRAPDFGRFLKAARWAAGILRDAGDHEGRAALAEASAAVWQSLRRRPYELPDRHGTAWLSDLAEQAGNNPAIGGRTFAGTLRGETVRLGAGTWAVLWALCRHHPADLPAAGRAWARKETAAVREAVREVWPPEDPVPSPFPDALGCGGGWEARRIATAGRLVAEAEAASNCLAGYLPDLLAGRRAVFAAFRPSGEPAGHFELAPGEGGVPELAQVMATRNRKPSPGLRKAAERAAAELAEAFPRAFGSEDRASCRAAKRAGMVVETARFAAHAEDALAAFAKACDRFGVEWPERGEWVPGEGSERKSPEKAGRPAR